MLIMSQHERRNWRHHDPLTADGSKKGRLASHAQRCGGSQGSGAPEEQEGLPTGRLAWPCGHALRCEHTTTCLLSSRKVTALPPAQVAELPHAFFLLLSPDWSSGLQVLPIFARSPPPPAWALSETHT